jgi:hypothetical protein
MIVVLEHNEYRVFRLEPDQIPLIIDALEPLLARSVSYTSGFSTVKELLDQMQQGIRPWQFWIVLNKSDICGSFITTLERVSNDILCTYEILAGTDAQEWIWPLVEKFEKYIAFMYGATMMRIVGRKGWEKFLRHHGYCPTHYITEKRLLPSVESIEELNIIGNTMRVLDG